MNYCLPGPFRRRGQSHAPDPAWIKPRSLASGEARGHCMTFAHIRGDRCLVHPTCNFSIGAGRLAAGNAENCLVSLLAAQLIHPQLERVELQGPPPSQTMVSEISEWDNGIWNEQPPLSTSSSRLYLKPPVSWGPPSGQDTYSLGKLTSPWGPDERRTPVMRETMQFSWSEAGSISWGNCGKPSIGYLGSGFQYLKQLWSIWIGSGMCFKEKWFWSDGSLLGSCPLH